MVKVARPRNATGVKREAKGRLVRKEEGAWRTELRGNILMFITQQKDGQCWDGDTAVHSGPFKVIPRS